MSTLPAAVTVTPLVGVPEVRAGDHLAALVVAALDAAGLDLADDDVLVISSKVVSKALGLSHQGADKDVVVAGETRRVLAERVTPAGVTRVVESQAGPVMAAAGVDASNTGDQDTLLLLPHDPDLTTRRLRADLVEAWHDHTGQDVRLGVILSDTAGRPWRVGQTDFALGAAGVPVVDDLRGRLDADGRELQATIRCIADEVAAAADLVKGKDRHVPVALVRGLDLRSGSASATPGERDGAASIVRTGVEDWFGYGRAEAVRAALGIEPGSAEADAVGIPPAGPEAVELRVARALTVALHAHPGVVAVDKADDLQLHCPDAFELGMAAARVRVALWGEGLTSTFARDLDDELVVHLHVTGITG